MPSELTLNALHVSSVVAQPYSLIMGFLDKREAHEMLLRCQPGTFIVRFTESEPGGVSIVWVKSKSVCLCVCTHVCLHERCRLVSSTCSQCVLS